MTSIVSVVVSKWSEGYSVLRDGDRFLVATKCEESAIAFKNYLATQFDFPGALFAGEVQKCLTYYQIEIETFGWTESDMQKFLHFDFSPFLS